MKSREIFSEIFESSLLWVFALVFGSYFLVSVFFRAYFDAALYADKPMLFGQTPLFVLLVSLAVLFFLGLKIASDKVDVKLKNIELYFIIASIFLQLFVIFALPAQPLFDSSNVYQGAVQMFHGNYLISIGDYFWWYPYQLPYTFLVSIFFRLFNSTNIFIPKILNIVFTTISMYFITKSYELLKGKKSLVSFVIIYLSPVMILMNNYIYNDIITTLLLVISTFYLLKYLRSKSLTHILVSATTLALANVFRPIGVVAVVAILIYYVFSKTSNKFKPILVVLLVFILVSIFPIYKVIGAYNDKLDFSKKAGVPIEQPVAIGLAQPLGWFDWGATNKVYIGCSYDKGCASKGLRELIQKRVQNLKAAGVLSLYAEKGFWAWTEGTYQVSFYGLGDGIYNKWYEPFAYQTPLTKAVISLKYRWVVTIMNNILYYLNMAMIFISVVGLIILQKKGSFAKYKGLIYLILLVLGIWGFFTISEMKSRYIFPALPYLLIIFLLALDEVKDCVYGTIGKKSWITRFLKGMNGAQNGNQNK